MTANQWLEVLASYSLQVLLVIAACKLLERVVARSSDRCAIWNTCFFSVLLLGCVELFLPRLHLIQPWSRLQPQTLLTVTAAHAIVGRILLAVWCIGATISLIRWIQQGYQLRRTLRRCERLSNEQVQSLLGATNTSPYLQGLVMLVSDDADGPFCWQFHQPTLVLPRFLLEGSQDDLRHVLLHELEHLNTNHPFQLFLQHLAQVVCWFHPAVWNAAKSASLVREFACDEAAAAYGANSAAYLRTLLHIAERFEQKHNSSAIGFVRSPTEIVLRARRLVELATRSQQAAGRLSIGRKIATAVVLVVACLLSLLSIPTDPLASSRSSWSPWPKWTAESLHCFGCSLRDYEEFDRRTQVYELMRGGDGVDTVEVANRSLTIRP
jgi:beta-lactamase regulating signal transducer with metallopeptidase domain